MNLVQGKMVVGSAPVYETRRPLPNLNSGGSKMDTYNLPDRFWSKVNVKGPGDCWEWTAGTRGGYGRFKIGGKRGRMVTATRYLMEAMLGRDLPRWTLVCHHCDNKGCLNPAHLFLGDTRANLRDHADKGLHYKQQVTHCPHGHEYSEKNTMWTLLRDRRVRSCRECRRLKDARRHARERLLKGATVEVL